jgi:L-xylulokinase
MNDVYLLGIDNGGTVAKAALFAPDGRELAVASTRTETLSPQPGWAEFDPEQLWRAAASSVRQAIDRSGVRAEQIAAVACTGHGNGLYLVDDAGRAVRRAIFSADTRARDYVARWTAAGVDRAVRPKTMQALWPGQPNALLAWLRDHGGETLRRARWALMCKDFIRLRLCGEALGELTDFSGTSLMDVETGRFDPDVLEAFGIAELIGLLPPLRLAHEVCGRVTAEAAEATGLAAGTPVAGGLFDIDACGLSSALLDESQLGMVFGTWSINQYVSKTPVRDGIFMTSRYAVPGHYLMLEGSATSASNLEWFLARLLGGGDDAAAGGGAIDYAAVNRAVGETDPADAAVLFLPFLYGTNGPADATGCLVGLAARHDRRHVLRAVYEGVVFGHATHLERLLRFRPMPETIRASGGAARSDVWMQMAADALGVPVEVPDASELGALGAAICASAAAGLHADLPAACGAMVRVARRYEPNPALVEVYRAKYRRYRRLLDALGPAWADLACRDEPRDERAGA